MSLVETSVRRPVFAWMLMGALLVFGGIGFHRMGVSQLPDVDFPIVNVSVTLEGAAPEVMESDIVDPIEDAVMSIQGLEGISSSARSGIANITIDFALNKNIDLAVQEVQTRIAQVQKRLPKDVDPPLVMKINPEDQPIMWISANSDSLTMQELMAFVRDRLKDRFTRLPGVGDVFLGGYMDPNLRVWVSSKKLTQYALTVDDVIQAIQLEHSELPSGRIESPEKEFNIRTVGEAANPKDFGRLPINRRGGAPNYTPIFLDQVAHVEEGLADIRRKSRVMGKPAVGLGIRKQRGANAVDVAKAVKARMEELRPELPKGVELNVNYDSTKFIEESVSELNFTLILSAILTAFACWLFLGSWSATMNVVLAIPTSVVGAFIVLNALGFTLNTFTLLGLSLAIGIVVDDAIMVLENIVRHRERGENRVNSALKGATEITFAAIAATAAIMAIFLPVAFMKGVIGKFFFEFGVTISVAVALSLLEALTLTPMRCSQFLDVGERTTRIGRGIERSFRLLEELYRKILPTILNNRWKTVLGSLLFFILTFALAGVLKKEFVPAQDQGNLMIRLKSPEGSSLEFTDKKMGEVEDYLKTRPEVSKYFVSVGGFGGGEVNTAIAFITLKPMRERKISQQKLADLIRVDLQKVQGVTIFIQDLSLSAFSASRGFPVEFSIRGPDWDVLKDLSQKVTEAISKTGMLADVDSDYLAGVQDIQLLPDREKSKSRGVSVADVARTVNALVGGVVAGKYSKGGHRNDIRVRLVEEERKTVKDLEKLFVRNNRGELIPLSDVVTIREHPSLTSISRKDRERAISIFSNLAPGKSQAQALDAVQKVVHELLPPGYRYVASGSAKTFKESFESLLVALVLGLLVSYMVLASQFNSFIHPVTVLVALPFSFSGAFISLLLGGQSLNMYSVIGLILLTGIVKKNSILLVDFTNQLREQGYDVKRALTEAGPIRLRPILMTSVATVVGAIPPALGIGPGAESRIPMALAVIGGVIVSTVLTLIVVPAIYSLFARGGGKSQPNLMRVKEPNLSA